jgi:hypothetical protein
MKALSRIILGLGVWLALFLSTSAIAPRAARALDSSELLGYFIDELTPYGQWVTLAPYGTAWMPNVAPDFHPYTQGYWVYSDYYGWVWQSSEVYGPIVYHYGRWVFDRGRWFWVPDDTWGPAWVDWRYSNNYVGWAPLPPDVGWGWQQEWRPSVVDYYPPEAYIFVPCEHFAEPEIVHYYVPYHENTVILKETRVITEYRTESGHVVNRGPRREDIERRSGRRIEPQRVEPHAIHDKPLPVATERHTKHPVPARSDNRPPAARENRERAPDTRNEHEHPASAHEDRGHAPEAHAVQREDDHSRDARNNDARKVQEHHEEPARTPEEHRERHEAPPQAHHEQPHAEAGPPQYQRDTSRERRESEEARDHSAPPKDHAAPHEAAPKAPPAPDRDEHASSGKKHPQPTPHGQ